MSLLKKLLRKIVNPGKGATIVAVTLFAASAIGMTVIFVMYPDSPLGYLLNILSVVLLAYLIFLIVLFCKRVKPKVVGWAQKYAFTRRFVASYDFRTMIYTAGKFLINLGYAAFNGVYGILFRAPWYIALFVYYTVLCVSRGVMVMRERQVVLRFGKERDRTAERLRIYRAAGILLLVMTLALNVMLGQMVSDPDQGFRYAGVLIFVAAIYTVYKMTMAIYNLFKARSSDDDAVHAVRNINFADALVSLLALQTAMVAQFSELGPSVWETFALGSVICVTTAFLGIYMIVKAQRRLGALAAESEKSDDPSDTSAVHS